MEDEQTLIKALNIVLLDEGFEVLSAGNGEAGIELAKKERPDLILLDIMMPKKDGFQVLRELKQDIQLASIPVIMLTNLGQEEEKEKSIQLGAQEYFIKAATDLNKLVEKIREILGRI